MTHKVSIRIIGEVACSFVVVADVVRFGDFCWFVFFLINYPITFRIKNDSPAVIRTDFFFPLLSLIHKKKNRTVYSKVTSNSANGVRAGVVGIYHHIRLCFSVFLFLAFWSR